LNTVPKGEKVHNSYTFMQITFFVGTLLQLFQRIRNQHEILRVLIPISKKLEKIIFWVIIVFFANFEADRAQNGPKYQKSFFQKKLYFPILVSDQQVVKIVSP
jgi:hypothetical protein